MPDKIHILITFALEDALVGLIRDVDPARVEIEILAPEQRQLLRGKYPSESERAAVARGLHRAFDRAEVVFGFWGAELHHALIDARATGGSAPVATIREAAPRLKWIQLTSAGADRLLNSGFVEQGITVTTVSGLHATPIGEFIIGAILQWAKGAPRTTRAQLRHEWTRFAPAELRGKTVGIIGLGHIGAEAGRLAKAFGCRVIATKRSAAEQHADAFADEIWPSGELPRLLAESDYAVICVPLTSETRGLIGERELRTMKPSAFLVNIARGPVIVEAALIRALNEGWIAGAALDVFDQEPTPTDNPLLQLDNFICAPHMAGVTQEAVERMAIVTVQNMLSVLDGKPNRENVVNREVLA